MKVLVVYASKAGSTKGIADFIGEKLRQRGFEADVVAAATATSPEGYGAFVIGSAVYYGHWLKEAKEFVSRNRLILASRPVWIFSSGPTGTAEVDKKGRSVREASAPRESDEIRSWVSPRDHHVFYGAFDADQMTGAGRLFARMIPRDAQGDFRNWAEIEAWTEGIATALAA